MKKAVQPKPSTAVAPIKQSSQTQKSVTVASTDLTTAEKVERHAEEDEPQPMEEEKQEI